MNIDIRKYAPQQVESVDPTKLSEEIEKLRSIKNQIEELENRIKDLKEDEKHWSTTIIPKIMEDMNLSTLKLRDGSELSIKKVFSATMKADKKAECIQWLRDNDLGDIVKNNITVAFGQGEENKAMAYATLAKESGYEPSQTEKVESQTLRVVMQEYKNKGNDIPGDLFHTFEGNQTKIK